MLVCRHMCLSAYISQKPNVQDSTNFICVSLPSFDCIAICVIYTVGCGRLLSCLQLQTIARNRWCQKSIIGSIHWCIHILRGQHRTIGTNWCRWQKYNNVFLKLHSAIYLITEMGKFAPYLHFRNTKMFSASRGFVPQTLALCTCRETSTFLTKFTPMVSSVWKARMHHWANLIKIGWYFVQISQFLPLDTMLSRYMLSSCICLSVHVHIILMPKIYAKIQMGSPLLRTNAGGVG